MIDSYMPHSPAKRGPLRYIRDWGSAIIRELTEGVKRSLLKLENTMPRLALLERMTMLSQGSLQPAVANSYSTNNIYHQGGNNIYITVQDGEDLIRTLHKMGVDI
jgi:hypothetical protein